MYIYRIGHSWQIDSIFTYGNQRQFVGSNDGTWYGDGVYSKFTAKGALHGYPKYGNTIFRNEITDLSRFLIFDEGNAKSVYGANHSIKDQVYYLFPQDVANKVWAHMTSIMQTERLARPEHHMFGQTSILPQCMLHRDRRANKREWYETLFSKYNVRGIVYTGGNDGLCVVPYVFDEVKPDAYYVVKSNADAASFNESKFIKKEFKGVHFADPVHKFGHLYKKIFNQISVSEEAGGGIYSKVITKNGKYNMINAENGDLVSPKVNFDFITDITPDNGTFTFEYQGKSFLGCPYGILPYGIEGDCYDYEADNLDYFVQNYEEDIDDDQFNEMKHSFKNIVNEVISDIDINEIKHGEFELPTLKELDDDNFVSVYKAVTVHNKSEYLKFLFTYGWDRRLAGDGGTAYGEGVYSWLTPSDASVRWPGNMIIQFKLIGGFNKFLIFNNPTVCTKVYGRDLTIIDQLRTFLDEKKAQKAYSEMHGSSSEVSRISHKYGIRGAIYPFNGSYAVLPFDFSSCIPYAISEDKGHTWKKGCTEDTLERFASSMDVKWQYGSKYANIEMPIKFSTLDGEGITGYACVTLHNGKENIIDIQTGEKISPIDFDECQMISPENGYFDFTYNNKSFKGNIWGVMPYYYSQSNEDTYDFDSLDYWVNQEGVDDEINDDDFS